MQLGMHNVIAQQLSESLMYLQHSLCDKRNLLCMFLGVCYYHHHSDLGQIGFEYEIKWKGALQKFQVAFW